MKTKFTLVIITFFFVHKISVNAENNNNVFKIGINKTSYQTAFYIRNTDFICTTLHGLLNDNIIKTNHLELEIYNVDKTVKILDDPNIYLDYDHDIMLIQIDSSIVRNSSGFVISEIGLNSNNNPMVIGVQGRSMLQSSEELVLHEIDRLGDDMTNTSFSIPNPNIEVIFLGGIIVNGFSGAPVFIGNRVYGLVSGSNYLNKIFAIPLSKKILQGKTFQKFDNYRNELVQKHTNPVINHLYIYNYPFGELYQKLLKKIDLINFSSDSLKRNELIAFSKLVKNNKRINRICRNSGTTSNVLSDCNKYLLAGELNKFYALFNKLLQDEEELEKQNSLFKNREIRIFQKAGVDILIFKKTLATYYAEINFINTDFKKKVISAFGQYDYEKVLNLFVNNQNHLGLLINPQSVFDIYLESYQRAKEAKNSIIDITNNLDIPVKEIHKINNSDTIYPACIVDYYDEINSYNQRNIIGNEKNFIGNTTKEILNVPLWYKENDLQSLMNYLSSVVPYGESNKLIMKKFPITIKFLTGIREFISNYENNHIDKEVLNRIYLIYYNAKKMSTDKEKYKLDLNLWENYGFDLTKEIDIHYQNLSKCLIHYEEIQEKPEIAYKNDSIKQSMESVYKIIVERVNQTKTDFLNNSWQFPTSEMETRFANEKISVFIEIGSTLDLQTSINALNYGLGEYEVISPWYFEKMGKLISDLKNIILQNTGREIQCSIRFLGKSDAIPFKHKLNSKVIYMNYRDLQNKFINLQNGSELEFDYALMHKNLNNYALAYMRAYVFKHQLSQYCNFNNNGIWVDVSQFEGGNYRGVKAKVTFILL